MKKIAAVAVAVFVGSAAAQELRVSSEQSVGGFVFPESCAYDPASKSIFVGSFGGDKLDPAAKDGKGSILKVDLHGKVLDKQYFPAAAGEPLNKPKGIWIQGNRLWVTIPDRYRVGHEAHFGEVATLFFHYLREPKALPAWEKANMLAKYFVTTAGLELARHAGASV